jgi:lysozyme
MCFNLGLQGLLGFKDMMLAIEAEDYDRAANEMLESKWATQVGERAICLAGIMRHGEL